jgi:hypothetical protein
MTLTAAHRERAEVCVHEASHAVAAVLLGAEIRRAVVPRRSWDDMRGFCVYEPGIGQEVLLASTYAGPWGAARWRAGHYPSRADILAVFDAGGCHDRAALRSACNAQGRDVESAAARMVVPLLQRCWPAVTDLALKLFFDGEVYNDDALKVLRLDRDPGVRAFQLANVRAGVPLGSFTVTAPAALLDEAV